MGDLFDRLVAGVICVVVLCIPAAIILNVMHAPSAVHIIVYVVILVVSVGFLADWIDSSSWMNGPK